MAEDGVEELDMGGPFGLLQEKARATVGRVVFEGSAWGVPLSGFSEALSSLPPC